MSKSESDENQLKIKSAREITELRDFFAMASIEPAFRHCQEMGVSEARTIALYAYDLADAMLEVRAGWVEALMKNYVGFENG